MSVTFSIDRPRQSVPSVACPVCGAQSGVAAGDPSCTYGVETDGYGCMGYGPTPTNVLSDLAEGLNVSNTNAAVILFDLLGYGRDEQESEYGSLDPADVLRRLATAEGRVTGLVRPTTESRGVYIDSNGVGEGALIVDCGLGLPRLWTYVGKLRTLASTAQAEGRKITYG